jgi:hypothetical protein
MKVEDRSEPKRTAKAGSVPRSRMNRSQDLKRQDSLPPGSSICVRLNSFQILLCASHSRFRLKQIWLRRYRQGEKGIGRFSTMRLGTRLDCITERSLQGRRALARTSEPLRQQIESLEGREAKVLRCAPKANVHLRNAKQREFLRKRSDPIAFSSAGFEPSA